MPGRHRDRRPGRGSRAGRRRWAGEAVRAAWRPKAVPRGGGRTSSRAEGEVTRAWSGIPFGPTPVREAGDLDRVTRDVLGFTLRRTLRREAGSRSGDGRLSGRLAVDPAGEPEEHHGLAQATQRRPQVAGGAGRLP